MSILEEAITERDTAIKSLELKSQTANALVNKLNTSFAAILQ